MQDQVLPQNSGQGGTQYFSEQVLKDQASDPRRIGPGAWFFMEMIAVHANTRQEKEQVCRQIRQFCESFKCGQCQGHCRQYIRENPPEKSLEGEGLFDWVVTFRNSVQKRLNSPLYDREVLFQIHTDLTYAVCQQDCGSKGTENTGTANSSHSGHSSVRTTPRWSGGEIFQHNNPVSGGYYSEDAVARGLYGSDLSTSQHENYRVADGNGEPSVVGIAEQPYIELSIEEPRASKLASSFSSFSRSDAFNLYPRYTESKWNKYRK